MKSIFVTSIFTFFFFISWLNTSKAVYYKAHTNLTVTQNAKKSTKRTKKARSKKRQKKSFFKRWWHKLFKKNQDEIILIKRFVNRSFYIGLGVFASLFIFSLTPTILYIIRLIALVGIYYGIRAYNKIEKADRFYHKERLKNRIGFILSLLTLGFLLFVV